jgi:hypothetical protein
MDVVACRLLAAVLTIAVVFATWRLMRLGQGKKLANGQLKTGLEALVVDPTTSTFSLSKLQLYAWLLASVSVYLYYFSVELITQGKFAAEAYFNQFR